MYSKLGRKITNEEFDLRSIDFNRLDDYIDSKTSIHFSCKKCNKIFNKKPKELKKLKCSCLEKSDNYKDEISKKNIKLIDNYINIRTKVKHFCLNCNFEFHSSPKSILNSKIGCPSCSGKIFSIDKYKSLLPDNLILLDNNYNGSNKYHKHKCLDCSSEFETKPNYILHMKTNCPICNKSKGEREIIEFLNVNKFNYKTEYIVKISNRNLRFDFYLKDMETFIEYDGIQHFEPVSIFGGESSCKKQIEHDNLKDKWCLENNKKLIRIPYFENIKDVLYKELI
jgi:DNA-directed RNA polymerase subunit RPC12/RpoP/very-short-patch-repair endonuclease